MNDNFCANLASRLIHIGLDSSDSDLNSDVDLEFNYDSECGYDDDDDDDDESIGLEEMMP